MPGSQIDRLNLLVGLDRLGRAYLEDLYAFYGDAPGVRVARKHLGWYCRQHPGQELMRERLMRIETTREQLSAVAELFDAKLVCAA